VPAAPIQTLPSRPAFRPVAFGLIGAAAGGCLGYFAFFWIARQGLYALLVPPALLGLVAGLCARDRSPVLAITCGIAGLGLGLFTEWRFAPFYADGSLNYFIKHVHQLKPYTMIMLAIGTFFSYRLALGYSRPAPSVPEVRKE
jgi:hypothetical protein